MESATSISSNPRTVEEIFKDFRGRRAAIARALTTDVDKFYSLCDPEKENLCLYGYPNDTWKVDLPVEEVPPELPEPALGINFARDGMQKKDWLSLVAVHSDSWLLAVAFYHGAQINHNDRKRLFGMINDLPTVFELVRKQPREKTNAEHGGNKSKVPAKRMSNGQVKNSKSISLVEDDETYEDDDDEEHSDAMCGICGESYSGNEFWIMCDVCDRWYHGKCVKVTAAKAQSIKQYRCPPCSSKKAR